MYDLQQVIQSVGGWLILTMHFDTHAVVGKGISLRQIEAASQRRDCLIEVVSAS